MVSFISLGKKRLALVGIAFLPWALWLVGIWTLREWYRAGKDPGLYTGVCYKQNGLAVSCTFEQWQVWDATPAVDIFILAGGIAAAAVTGVVSISFLRKK